LSCPIQPVFVPYTEKRGREPFHACSTFNSKVEYHIMPTFEYQCRVCGRGVIEVQRIPNLPCPAERCDGTCKQLIGGIGFVLKGDGWYGKNQKLKGQMSRKNQKLDARTAELKKDAPPCTLVPNVAGEQTDSWSDAAKLAKDKGLDSSGYNIKATKESRR